MILILNIEDLPPMPRNRSHMLTVSGKRPMNIKTPLCREFEKTLEGILQAYLPPMEKFKSAFVPKKHFISAEFFIYAPKEVILTQEQVISSRCPDFDSNKALTDVIFKVLQMDDKLIKSATIKYLISPSNNWDHIIILRLENLETLYLPTSSLELL